jgi:prepilin-type N-terminal cleavage/methylation domain-containing protein
VVRKVRSNELGRQPGRRAFSLIELMVSVAILAVIIVGLLAMFGQVQRSFRAGTTQVDVMEAGRAATTFIARELQEMTATPLTNGANFFAVVAANQPYALQELASGEMRTNELWDLSFVTRANDEWTGIGYRISNAVAGAGTLYRLVATADAGNYSDNAEGPTNVVRLSTNLANSSVYQDLGAGIPFNAQFARTNYHRVADGVVHFKMTAFDTNGVPFEDRWRWDATVEPALVLGGGPTFLGYGMSNSILPAFVQIEVGVLEPAAIAKFQARLESTPGNPTKALNYLSNNVGKVHLFRQRVPIRPSATAVARGY